MTSRPLTNLFEDALLDEDATRDEDLRRRGSAERLLNRQHLVEVVLLLDVFVDVLSDLLYLRVGF